MASTSATGWSGKAARSVDASAAAESAVCAASNTMWQPVLPGISATCRTYVASTAGAGHNPTCWLPQRLLPAPKHNLAAVTAWYRCAAPLAGTRLQQATEEAHKAWAAVTLLPCVCITGLCCMCTAAFYRSVCMHARAHVCAPVPHARMRMVYKCSARDCPARMHALAFVVRICVVRRVVCDILARVLAQMFDMRTCVLTCIKCARADVHTF